MLTSTRTKPRSQINKYLMALQDTILCDTFLSFGHLHGMSPPGRAGEQCEARLTKITRCPVLRYVGGAGFTHAFSILPTC